MHSPSLIRTGIESLELSQANSLEELETSPVFTEPRKIIDPSLPVLECPFEADVIHGRSILLDREDLLILFEKDGELLAAYEKREDGRYHCLRGLL